jgi:hypothetical protein
MLEMVAASVETFGIIHILCVYGVEILIVEEVDRSYSGI